MPHHSAGAAAESTQRASAAGTVADLAVTEAVGKQLPQRLMVSHASV
jgi:hypothetical protein